MFCADAIYVLFRFPCGCRGFQWSLIPAPYKTLCVGSSSPVGSPKCAANAERTAIGFSRSNPREIRRVGRVFACFCRHWPGVRPSRDRGSVGGFTAFRNTISGFLNYTYFSENKHAWNLFMKKVICISEQNEAGSVCVLQGYS